MIISFSSFDKYERCPALWHFYKNHTKQSAEFLERVYPGKFIHSLNEQWLLLDRPEWSHIRLMEKIGLLADRMAAEGKPHVIDTKFCNRVIEGFNKLSKRENEWIGNYQFKVEDLFAIDISSDIKKYYDRDIEIIVRGSADLTVFREQPVVYDFKFTDSDWNVKKEQLNIYFYALEKKHKRPFNRGGFYLIESDKLLEVEESEGQRDAFLKRLFKVCVEMQNLDKPEARPSTLVCRYCPYTGVCEDRLKEFQTGQSSWR